MSSKQPKCAGFRDIGGKFGKTASEGELCGLLEQTLWAVHRYPNPDITFMAIADWKWKKDGQNTPRIETISLMD